MNQQRYDILQQLLAEGRVKVDLETGLVYNRFGKHKGRVNRWGYLDVNFTVNGKRVGFKNHEIVAVAGGMNIVGITVNHKDEIKLHNWFSNLEPMTLMKNIEYSVKRRNGIGTKLTIAQALEIRQLYGTGLYSRRALGRKFSVSHTTITKIINLKGSVLS